MPSEDKGPFVVRIFLRWEENETVAVAGPFEDGEAVAKALEKAGYRRRNPDEDPLTAWWEPGGVEIIPLAGEIPQR